MEYLSTRGLSGSKRFLDVLLEGLASDGGLYVPASYPQVDTATLERWRSIYHQQGYAELAFQILRLYIDDIPEAELRALCTKTYTEDVFETGEIVPLRHIENGLWLEALSNGPTFAFKDMGMQLLGYLFEYALARQGYTLNILGATSGDTGSAAEYAMRGKKGVRVFMTSPVGRMSAFQRAQMFSLTDDNIVNIAIEGDFDTCQDLVKAVSHDANFKHRYRIGAVNSINWARLLAQVVYYFAGYFQATESHAHPDSSRGESIVAPTKVSFAIPSGNFGNACAGHIARSMGLPIDKLVVATNENDVLDEFFRSGMYRVRPGAQTYATSSPSMDISKASNFERFVFDMLGRDSGRVRALFIQTLVNTGYFDLSRSAAFQDLGSRFGFVSGKSTHADRIATIRDTQERHAMLIDPHTADGVTVARRYQQPDVPMIVLETALPVKFAETIIEAVGTPPPRPTRCEGLEDLPQSVITLPASVDALRDCIARHCPEL
ncbi:threonine synthase [Candidatus Symbiobacter mobilis]|nr:threonine synthase [Candidatus Symbiobacter mobilis]